MDIFSIPEYLLPDLTVFKYSRASPAHPMSVQDFVVYSGGRA